MSIFTNIINHLKYKKELYPLVVRDQRFTNEQEILAYIKEHQTDWYVICDFPVEISCNPDIFDKAIDIIASWPNGFGRDEVLKRLKEAYSDNRYPVKKSEKMKNFSDFYIANKK